MKKFSFMYLVVNSGWPLAGSIMVWKFLDSFVFWAHFGVVWFVWIIFGFILFIFFVWIYDVIQESWAGLRSKTVSKGLRWGVVLFMVSEAFLFFSFFWSYFHSCLSPSIYIGDWPPLLYGGLVLDPFGVPLLNTILLLSSGVSMTLCHHCLLGKDNFGVMVGYMVTIILGGLFLVVQFNEYQQSYFSVSSTFFGTVFFMLTGFHGFHVCMGLIFMIICFLRVLFDFDFSSGNHVSFQAAAWYWHFVDVVWIFLFFFVYCYGY